MTHNEAILKLAEVIEQMQLTDVKHQQEIVKLNQNILELENKFKDMLFLIDTIMDDEIHPIH